MTSSAAELGPKAGGDFNFNFNSLLTPSILPWLFLPLTSTAEGVSATNMAAVPSDHAVHQNNDVDYVIRYRFGDSGQ